MKKIFLLLISLLLLTSCESLSTKRKTVTFNNKSNKTNTSVTSSTSNTTKPSSSSNTTKSNSSSSSTQGTESTAQTTKGQKRKGKLAFQTDGSGGEDVSKEADFIIYEGEDLLIGLTVNGELIDGEVSWYHTKTEDAVISLYGSYLFIKGIREAEITIVAETEDYEATGVVKILSKKNLLVDYFKTKGYEESTEDGDTEYYFCEMEVLNGVTYTYYFSYFKNEDLFKVYCNRKHTIDGASLETEGIITWSWGHYDQAKFVVTETIKPNNSNLDYSTTIEFDNSCITFSESTQNINIPTEYLYRVTERGWETITSEDLAEMWASVKSGHDFVLKFIKEKQIDVKLFHESKYY